MILVVEVVDVLSPLSPFSFFLSHLFSQVSLQPGNQLLVFGMVLMCFEQDGHLAYWHFEEAQG